MKVENPFPIGVKMFILSNLISLISTKGLDFGTGGVTG